MQHTDDWENVGSMTTGEESLVILMYPLSEVIKEKTPTSGWLCIARLAVLQRHVEKVSGLGGV